MELIALSLGLAPNRFRGFFRHNTSNIRLNHYPPCPYPHLALGLGRHKDTGVLTVLAQDDVGGLEVRRKADGEWIRVKPISNSFIINVGDMIQVSNTCWLQIYFRCIHFLRYHEQPFSLYPLLLLNQIIIHIPHIYIIFYTMLCNYNYISIIIIIINKIDNLI